MVGPFGRCMFNFCIKFHTVLHSCFFSEFYHITEEEIAFSTQILPET